MTIRHNCVATWQRPPGRLASGLMSASHRPRFDGLPARLAALGVALLAGLALFVIHYDDLFPPEGGAAVDPDDPVQLCIAAEKQTLDTMVAGGSFTEEQAARALAGAEARCFDQFGGNNQIPSQ